MLLDQANPYRPRLPQVLHLDWEDFDSHLSAANDEAIGQEREWSVVAYMAANCNLAEYMFDNLLELKSIASNPAMHVCVLFAGPLITDTFFARLNPGGTLSDDIVFRFSAVNSSDLHTLAMAFQCANIFPARRRLAFLSGHGQGWKGVLLNQNLGRNYANDPARLQSPGPRAICQARIFASLQRTQDHINGRLEKLPQMPRRPPDILAFDACYMGNLEVVTTLAAEARIFVVMEGRAPGEGLPYAKILTELQNNSTQPAEDLARYILKANGEKYEGRDLALRQTALTTAGLVPLTRCACNFDRATRPLQRRGVFQRTSRDGKCRRARSNRKYRFQRIDHSTPQPAPSPKRSGRGPGSSGAILPPGFIVRSPFSRERQRCSLHLCTARHRLRHVLLPTIAKPLPPPRLGSFPR